MKHATLLVFAALVIQICALFAMADDGRAVVPAAAASGFRVASEPTYRPRIEHSREPFRMPGEFEHQDSLVLSCGMLTESHADTIAQVAQEIRRSIRVLVLYSHTEQLDVIKAALERRMDSLENIYLIQTPHDTKWVRDYGPTLLRSQKGFRMVDWLYEEDRPQDELVPSHLATMGETVCETASIRLPGGNLLSNGQGICVTTTAVLQVNSDLGITKADLYKQLANRINAQELVVLQPLVGELTGHVDMFVTFTGPNTVVVGQYTKEEDAENAAILDRNAARLAAVKTPRGRLRVERIPMGSQDDDAFRTYTNCIYANGVLVVPTYRDADGERLERALACYRHLLPQWRVVCVDASQLIEGGGALHCASLNIAGFSKPLKLLPIAPSPPLGSLAAVAMRAEAFMRGQARTFPRGVDRESAGRLFRNSGLRVLPGNGIDPDEVRQVELFPRRRSSRPDLRAGP